MQVDVEETTVIQPLHPPFDGDHILSLSHLDNDRNLLVFLRYLRVYSDNPHNHSDPCHVITSGLSAALIRYYPFAGTLRRRQSDGRLALHCRSGDGVTVVRASVNRPLSSVNYFISDVDDNLTEQLVPDPDPDQDMIRPITLQVTRFSCGGLVLGAAVHHAICDGYGATLFFTAIAELASGSGRISIDPVWERSSLLGSRNPPRVEYPFRELLSLDKDISPYTGSGKRVVKEWLDLKEEVLDRLKGHLFKQSGLKFTTFEALCAFIWRARTKWQQVPGDEKVTLAYSMDIRKMLKPHLPKGYWGNGCVPLYVNVSAQVVVEQPIWRTAECIKKSKNDASSEYVSWYIDFQELHYKQGIIGGRRVSAFTDWRHLGHATVDFGWGSPVAVVPLSSRLLGSNEPCFLLPAKDGIKVLVHLEEHVVPMFRQEIDLLRNLDA